MTRSKADDTTFTYDLSSPNAPSLMIAPSANNNSAGSTTSRARARGLLSWTTLATLFMLYLIMSLAQRVERFRAEVSFVANEIKDLRKYGVGDVSALESVLAAAASASASASAAASAAASSRQTSTSYVCDPPTPASDTGRGGEVTKHPLDSRRTHGEMSTSLGRVVFGRSAWDKWAAHPT